jgi:redox-sensitive bicupin YhaK (pirin superfamily)
MDKLLDEPIVGSGPFVMNSPEEIADYQSGTMGG